MQLTHLHERITSKQKKRHQRRLRKVEEKFEETRAQFYHPFFGSLATTQTQHVNNSHFKPEHT